MPNVTYIKPAGVPLRFLEEVTLSVEEVEAIRLKDLEALDQMEAAEKMNVSRPTYQRVLISARRKIADALLNGKAIRIEGGNFEIAPGRLRCAEGHEWDMPQTAEGECPPACPRCGSSDVTALHPQPRCAGRGRGRGPWPGGPEAETTANGGADGIDGIKEERDEDEQAA